MFIGKKAGEMPHFVNVLDYADAGKVDPHSPEDGSFDNLDLDNIRRFVQLDIRLRTQGEETVGYGRTIPSIARQVLVSFWEEPRTGFHYKEIRGLRKPVDFGPRDWTSHGPKRRIFASKSQATSKGFCSNM